MTETTFELCAKLRAIADDGDISVNDGNTICRAVTLIEALAKPASEPADGAVRDRDIARWKRDSELLSAIQDECWDVRFTDTPNADAGDYNVNIEIVGHFMAEPQERVVGENYNEDLRAALEQAMTAEPYPPARPVYDERAALSAPASSSPAEAALTQKQFFLLEWLSKEDSSSLGECQGFDLDEIVSRGLAKIGDGVKGRPPEYHPVSLTEAGMILANARRNKARSAEEGER